MRPRVAPVIPIGLRFARGICRTFFDVPMSRHGLVGAHKVIDDIDYWIVPRVGDLEMSWHCEKGKRHESCALLEINIDEHSCSRIFWESEKHWQYSMMGLEDERRINKRALEFLVTLNKAMITNFGIGEEIPVDEGLAQRIITFHAHAILIERNKKR